MFWKFDLHATSHIDTLLERDDVRLTDIMDEEDVLQECKAQNHKLIDFLLRPECMEDLVTFITQEPSTDVEDNVKYKYPNISCELLTSDVSQINDRLVEDEKLLIKLYSFLQNEPPLNPLLASFFSKVLSILIGRKPEQIVGFLRKREDFVNFMIKHIGTSAIMDLLLRMLTCIEPPLLRQDVLNWLNQENIIENLVDMVQPSQDEDRHSNASQSLCEIIRLSRDQMFQVQGCPQPDPLLATLEKQTTVEKLLSHIFDKEKNESAIVSVIQILLTLFETRRPAFEGHMECSPRMSNPSFSVNQSILEAVRPRLKDFHQLLLDPPKNDMMKTTWGVLDPPVGNTRLHVVRLVVSLLQTNTPCISKELIHLNTLGIILDMYFRYIWNNFLHIQVEICTAVILVMPPFTTDVQLDAEQENARESILVRHLFQKCHFIQRIVEAWNTNEKEQVEGGRRRGYMGHLTRIANSILHNCDKGPNGLQIQQLISELKVEDREKWEAFISGQLADTNKRNTVDLVNTHQIQSSTDDEVEFKDSSFHHDSSIQQFGFNDEEFADPDDVLDIPFDRISDISFSLNTNESVKVAMFEARCREKIQQFEDVGSDEEDIWDEKDVTFVPEAQRRPRSAGSTDSEDSTDSEEEDSKKDVFEASNPNSEDMEVETDTAWSGYSGPDSNSGTGWADFSNFSPTSPNDPLMCNTPVAMETNIEKLDPLGVIGPLYSEENNGWLSPSVSSSSSVTSKGCGRSKMVDESTCNVQRSMTDTVINGSLKETFSLTVDAKTETAVFKRVLKSYRSEKCKYTMEFPNGPREEMSNIEDAKLDQSAMSSDPAVNGPA
ncbi:serine/threonine-protein phosphatase 6 regulatory subunit 3 isoform X5 [Corythoichthys intestinalis]|uniref:serine/threonine-protein phosphatase 6 regulatory subunit 3 isoform X5 n=1 Tax=Corythoichthys intestinalis TaxID=161448 RepID=UPI0025A6828F|nr:serine/threonine-protein phosphatase 6 regulatory subunit 3 isoform X5 [Corythoichthys intestinalis]